MAEPAETAGSDDPSRWSRVRVATKYPNIARRHFASRGVHAEVVHLNGAMELAPGLGLSRLIVDLVQTGSTLRANGLVETEVIAPGHQPADRQPHRAEDPARGDRRLDRPVPGGAGPGRDAAVNERLATADPDFDAAFDACVDQARETTERVDRAGRRHHRRRCAPGATPR